MNQTSPQPNLPPQTSPSSQPQGNTDALQALIPTKNKQALSSYYCGVFGLIPIIGIPLSIIAIVLALSGLKKYKSNPTPGAKGHAITGLVLGIFELLVLVAFIIFVLLSD